MFSLSKPNFTKFLEHFHHKTSHTACSINDYCLRKLKSAGFYLFIYWPQTYGPYRKGNQITHEHKNG